MPILNNDERIHDTALITGTGEYTLLGAPTGKQPASVVGAGNYFMAFVSDDINWEAGLYTYVAGPGRVQRTHVVKSSNGGVAVNWNNASVKIKSGWPAWIAAPRRVVKSVAGNSDVTLTALEQRCNFLELTGVLTANINVIVDETVWSWPVFNNTSGAFSPTLKTIAGTGVEVKQGKIATLFCDGTNVVPGTNANLLRGTVLSRSTNTILGLENHGDTLLATAGFTQTLTAAATLGQGWFVDVIVDSGATLVIDPNGAETIDGATTKSIVGPLQGRVVCNGALFRTVGFSANNVITTRGDMIRGSSVGGAVRLGLGTLGQVVRSSGVDLVWGDALILGEPVNSTSGSLIDYNSIPAGVKKIDILLNGVSTSGVSGLIIQVGDSGGIENTGYLSTVGLLVGGTTVGNTSGFIVASPAAASVFHGIIQLRLLDSSTNTWVCQSNISFDAGQINVASGSKSLSAMLDRIRITTVGGTDTFDLGKVNIQYQF